MSTIAGPTRRAAVIRGIWWMTGAAFLFAVISFMAREMSATLSLFQIALFQSVGATLGMLPWLVRAGTGALRTRRLGVYAFRAVAGTIAFVTMFYGLQHLTLADATALLFTTPLFTVLFAAAFMGETVGPRRWAAIAAGFVGAMIIIRPDTAGFSWPALSMVTSAAAFGAVNASTRQLTKTENANAMVLYMYALMVPLTVGPAIADWRPPGWADLPWIVVLGVVTILAQQAITRSFAAAPAAVVMPAYYMQLLFAAAIGFIAYREQPDIWIWAGAVVICGSTYYLAYTESRQRT